MTQASKVDEPVFVLTLPRSGSTLLRYLIDAHSAMTCPPETQLSLMCANIMNCWLDYQHSVPFEEREKLALKQVRQSVRAFVKWHLEQSGKELFCEKSLPNVEYGYLLANAFPRAKFICLYRHPMDFVASSVQTCRWGYSNFGLYPYAAASVDNLVFGLARAWSEKTAGILSLERDNPERCLRIKYEDIVTHPEKAYLAICTFVGVPFEEDAIATALAESHAYGRGDRKVVVSDRLNTDSIGKGSSVPAHMIPPPALAHMNAILRDLEYCEIGESWNIEASPLRADLGNEDEFRAVIGLFSRIERRLTDTSQDVWTEPHRLGFLLEEYVRKGVWTLDFCQRTASWQDFEQTRNIPVVICRTRALRALAADLMEPSEAFDVGDLRFSGNPFPHGVELLRSAFSLIREPGGRSTLGVATED